MREPHRYACLLLAAGGSRRLGSPKQLWKLDGETLIHRAARLAVEAAYKPVIVVLGSSAGEIREALHDLPLRIVENADWEAGMSTSLKVGINAVMAEPEQPTHLLVLVCDQVALTADALKKLQAASVEHPDRIVAANYNEKLGVPAIFPAGFLPLLLKVEGDRGARSVLQAMQEQVVAVTMPEGAEDVDTPMDAERAALKSYDDVDVKVPRKS